MTVVELAEVLGVSPDTVRKYARRFNIKNELINGVYKKVITDDDAMLIAKEIDSLYDSTDKQFLVKDFLKGGKSIKEVKLDRLKKEHPLVTDERCFITSWFPEIDSYFILSECNYHRGER